MFDKLLLKASLKKIFTLEKKKYFRPDIIFLQQQLHISIASSLILVPSRIRFSMKMEKKLFGEQSFDTLFRKD
jgi:hypothetical protein